MTAVYLAPVYILINIYLFLRMLRWAGACAKVFKNKWVCRLLGVLYLFFAGSLLIAFLMPEGNGRRLLKLLSNYWLGVLLYLVLAIGIADGIRLVVCLIKRKHIRQIHSERKLAITGAVCALAVIGLSLWGVIQARIIRVTPYEITVDKEAGNLDSLKVVLVADLHLGYNIGVSHMEQMVEKINEQDADLVVIAGDIFDNEYEALEDPEKLAEILKGIESKYGVYACYGNHDVEEAILAGFTFGGKKGKSSSEEMDAFLEASNIRLLQEEGVLIEDSFYLYGRPDYERPGNEEESRKSAAEITKDMDLSKPVLVIDHEPRELDELAAAGVDVDLCGHTHDGQMFPANLTVRLMWENAYGYLKKNEMHNIVTSGVGLFGPNMRVGTKAEICPVTIHFRESKVS